MKKVGKVLVIGAALAVIVALSSSVFAGDKSNHYADMTTKKNASVEQTVSFVDGYGAGMNKIFGHVACYQINGSYAYMDYIYQDATCWGGKTYSKQVSNKWTATIEADGPIKSTGGQYGVYISDDVYGTYRHYVSVSK